MVENYMYKKLSRDAHVHVAKRTNQLISVVNSILVLCFLHIATASSGVKDDNYC